MSLPAKHPAEFHHGETCIQEKQEGKSEHFSSAPLRWIHGLQSQLEFSAISHKQERNTFQNCLQREEGELSYHPPEENLLSKTKIPPGLF